MKKVDYSKFVSPNASHISSLKHLKTFEAFSAPVPNNKTERYFLLDNRNGFPDSDLGNFIENNSDIKVSYANDFENRGYIEDLLEGSDGFVYNDAGIALLAPAPEEVANLYTKANLLGLSFIPETIFELNTLISENIAPSNWQIAAVNANNSPFTGKGIKVCVIDTGFDLKHPDFAGREIITQDFSGSGVQDSILGHGTHCIGLACGNSDLNGLRYGIASQSDIYVARVFNTASQTSDNNIISAIYWAVQNGCQVASLSLGAGVRVGEPVSPIYNSIGAYALNNNCLLFAAAGNNSNRNNGYIAPVNSPGNDPSFLAIGASTEANGIAYFSCGSVNPGQVVNFAAPGFQVYSAWPTPLRYNTISGTSMATPIAAGIAALLCDQYPTYSAWQIKQEMIKLARQMPGIPVSDQGNGLVQAI